MNIFSLRALSIYDAGRFIKELITELMGREQEIYEIRYVEEYKPDKGSECCVEIKTSAELYHIRNLLREEFPNDTLMIQTLRECPLCENSLEVDPSIE